MNIRTNDLVLEIGSGHNPKIRSDVLCDRYLTDDTERGGSLTADRPLVVADGEALPFRDKTFEYVICSHVLEHADDAARFLGEVERVGKAGYIETPSEIGEWLYGWEYHRWLVNLADGKLLLKPKTMRGPFGWLFHEAVARDPLFSEFHERHHPMFLVRYEWRESISFEIRSANEAFHDLTKPEVARMLLGRLEAKSVKQRLWGTLPPRWRARAKSFLSKPTVNRKRADLRDLLVCPKCHGDLTWGQDFLRCERDGLDFRIERGIPVLLLS